MPQFFSIAFSSFIFEDHDLSVFPLVSYSPDNLGIFEKRLPYFHVLAVRGYEDLVKCDGIPDFSLQFLDLDFFSRIYPVLFSTSLDDSVNGFAPSFENKRIYYIK